MGHLKVAVPPDLLFYNTREDINGTTHYKGLVFDIFHEICRVLNLTYDVIDAEGYSTKNTGIIDLIALGKADIGVAMVTATADRTRKVNFLTPFYRLETSFAIPSSEHYDQSFLLRPFQPFSTSIWQAIMASFIMLIIFFQVIQTFNQTSDQVNSTFIDNCVTCFKIVLRQSIPSNCFIDTIFSRFFISIMMVSSSVLIACYTANLIAMSTVVRQNRIDTFEKLSENPQYKVLFREGSAFYDIFMMSKGQTVSKIKQNQILDKKQFIRFSDIDFKGLAKRLIDRNLAFITGYDELLKVAEQDCQLQLSKEKWTGFLETFAISKTFKYEKQFNMIIQQMTSTGIIDKLVKYHRHVYFPQHKTCISRSKYRSLKDMNVHFVWMAMGMSLSFIVLIGEIIYKKFIEREPAVIKNFHMT